MREWALAVASISPCQQYLVEFHSVSASEQSATQGAERKRNLEGEQSWEEKAEINV